MSVRRGLLVKYVVYFATLVSVALIVSSLLHMVFSYREDREILGQLQQEEARSAALQIERFIQEIERHVAGSTLPLIDMLSANKEEQRLELSKLLRQVPAIADAALLAPTGRELAYVSRLELDAEGSGKDWTSDPAFVAARTGSTYFGRVYFRKETEPHLTIAVAGRSRIGPIVVTEVNLKFIWDVVSRIAVGTKGRAYVVDSDGYLIAHPDISLVLHKTDLSGLTQVRAARMGSSSAAAVSMVADDRLGRQVLTSFAPIPALGWFVFVEQPVAQAFAPLYAMLWRTGGLLIGGLVLSLIASILLARHVVGPIRVLQKGASEIGAGRLDHRIAIDTGDELESLSGEFNQMAARLQESHAGLESKVEERTRELAAANQHKSEFLATMSHELRTPLNAIIGFSDVLKKQMFGELNPKQAKYVEVINTSGKHLLSLINDILDLSKVEAGKMELDLAPFNVPAAVDNALALVRGRADGKSIVVAVDLDPMLDTAVADERKFRQILLNLLSNAVKFTPEGGSILVAGRRLAKGIEVSIGDSGIGIAPEDHAMIFEEFTQLNGAQRREGTGLGLALTKKLIERHGGSIRVESARGHGARFTVTLPQPERPEWPTS
jgi:signal transduction histidine kinase